VTQLTTEGWTLRLLLVGMVLVIVGLIGEKGEGRRTRR
jgi:hypothetical protein